MSSIRLLKDHAKGSKGQTVSVPFGLGVELVASGIGEYPPAVKPVPKMPNVGLTAADRYAADIARLNTYHAAAIKEVKDEADEMLKLAQKEHAAEIASIKAELEAANRVITELNAKGKK